MSQEFAPLRGPSWGRHPWARGSSCRSSGDVTDRVIAEYIADQGQGPEDCRVENGDFEPTSGGRPSSPPAVGLTYGPPRVGVFQPSFARRRTCVRDNEAPP